MVSYLGQSDEVEELNKILQSLLQINGSMQRLNVDTNEVSIVLPKEDYNYIVRVVEQNKNAKFYKFYTRQDGVGYFKLGNIKIVCGGI